MPDGGGGPSALVRAVRALPTLFRVGFAGVLAYRSEFLVWILATNMPLVMLLLWTAVARDGPIGGMGAKELSAYFLVTLIVRQLTGSWVVWELNTDIRQGNLALRLLKPIHPFLVMATDNLSALPMRALISFPIAVGALLWLGAGQVTHDPVLWLVAPVAVAGAWLLTFTVMLCIGTLGLFFESSLAVFDLWLGLFFTFSGYLMPLRLLPSWLSGAVRASPFPYMLAFPVELVVGQLSRRAALSALGIEWAYGLGFLWLSLVLWRRGLARFAAYGG